MERISWRLETIRLAWASGLDFLLGGHFGPESGWRRALMPQLLPPSLQGRGSPRASCCDMSTQYQAVCIAGSLLVLPGPPLQCTEWLSIHGTRRAATANVTRAGHLWLDREAAVVVVGDVRETHGGAVPSSAPLLMPTQGDQTGFLFSMKALIPSCPSCRPRLSTMVWEAR